MSSEDHRNGGHSGPVSTEDLRNGRNSGCSGHEGNEYRGNSEYRGTEDQWVQRTRRTVDTEG